MSNIALRQITLGILLALPVLLGPGMSYAEEQVRSGQFTGASNHVTTGTASIIREGDRYVVVLGDDFTLDGAPDPKVGFGTSGEYDIKSQLAHLQSNTGSQRYDVPAGLNIESYNELYIWCEKYSVPLGVAALQ